MRKQPQQWNDMDRLLTRHTAFYLVIAGTAFFTLLGLAVNAWWLLPALIMAGLTGLGYYDLHQTRHAIRRNYPVIGNLRFFFEFIRPEMRQYFIEDDTSELPFSRVDRSLVYQRAKRQEDKRPFGTQGNVYHADYEWINHSMEPSHPDPAGFRLTVGGPHCT